MVVSDNGELNITGDMEASGGLRLNNNRQKLRQRFDIVRKLGQGTYGKVQLALNKDTGEEVAIKTIKKAKIETEQDLVRIQREIQIMSSVQHPHIIHIYEVFENKEKIVLVMEYANGGELYDYLSYKKSLGECEARRLFRQIVSAVYYCHKNKICHRDLKLENILLDEKGNTKIADFGLSNVFDEQRKLSTFCGSPLYASPEIVKGTPYYGPEVDCWSLGVLLYTLVYGAMPFDGSNFRRLVKQISEGDYYEPKQPSEASSLIRRMLTVVPSKRATIEEVCTDWWVNLGYQDSLLTVAEEMCQAMPVRLDYLLQLVPPSVPQSAVPCNETVAETEKPVVVAKELDETIENIEKEMLEDDRKNNTLDETVKPMEADEGAESATRKHKLTSSTKSLTSDSNDKLGTCKKKQKKADKQDNALTKADSNVEANITEQNISSEKIQQELSKPEVKSEKVESIEENNNSKEIMTEPQVLPLGTTEAACNKELKEVANTEAAKSKTAHVENEKNSETAGAELATPKTKSLLESESSNKQIKSSKTEKCKKSQTKSSPKSSETPKEKVADKTAPPGGDHPKMESKTEETKVEDNEEKKKPVKAKGNNKNITTTKSENELPSSSTLTARRGSKSTDEKKLLFPALKVSEARKAFENKPVEKKSLVIPGLKVSAARKAFESPSVNTSPVTSKTASAKVTPLKTKETGGSVTAGNVSANDNLPKNKNSEPEVGEQQPEVVKDNDKDSKEIKENKVDKKDDISSKDKLQSEIKMEESITTTESKDNSPSHQQKIAGFVPTLDVSMAVKPSKRTVGKPPAAPRTPADTSGTSSGENTPDAGKIASSPLTKGTLRKTSIVKSLSNSKETSGLINSSPSSPDNDDESKKKFQGASSKDICGSESSFLARAFMSKSSDSSPQSPIEASVAEIKPSLPAEGKPKAVLDNVVSNLKPQKISSVEIHLNSACDEKPQTPKAVESLTKPAEATVEFSDPQPTLVRSSTPGKFTLLGVTSEVCFNVDAPAESEEPLTAALPAPSRTHQSLYMNVTLPPPPPASPSPEIINAKDSQKTTDSQAKVSEIINAPVSHTSPPKERIIPVHLEDSRSESSQQGYNVYRSKFCTSYSSKLGDASKYRAPSLERSESLSSTGSIDDLEDSFFDSVAGDSMLSGILARTRSILEEFTRDDSSRRFGSLFSRPVASSGSSSYRSDPFRDSFPKRDWFSDITSGFGSRLSRDTSDSFSSRTKSSKAWRSSGASHSSVQDNEAYLSDSGLRTRKKKNNLAFFGPDDDYMSDSSARSRRSAYSSSYSRSISRSISEEESQSSRSASYASSIEKNTVNSDNPKSFSRSVSRESSQQESSSNNSSRSNCQRRSSWSNRTTPVSSLESGSSAATVTYGSREKDGYNNNNNGSSNYYKYETKGNDDHLSRPRSMHSKELKDEHRSRSRSCFESALDEITSLYGTIRRPRSLLRYTKSLTKDELGNRRSSSIDDFDDLEEKLLKRMHRPRSILVLADPDGDNREEDDSSASSDPPRDRFRFSRDDVSRGGGSTGNHRSSRRDGAGRGSNPANTKTNFSANSYGSKGQGYPVSEAKDVGYDFKYGSGYKKKLINSDESKKKSQSHSVSAMTTEEMQEKNSSANSERSQTAQDESSLNAQENKHEEETKVDSSGVDELEINDIKTGAAGYWAKRYGSNSRSVPPGKNSQKSKELFCTSKYNESENSSKLNEKWMEAGSVKNEMKPVPNKCDENTIVGFARSITNELDQLQVDLSQRFGSQICPYDENSRPRRRFSISGNEISGKIFSYQKTSEGNHPSDVVPVIIPLANDGNVGCSNGYNQQNSTFIKDETVESSGSPTPTPTPLPTQSQTQTVNNEKLNKPQSNGYLSLTSEDEMSTPTEADDSCSVCSDTNETAAARRSPCMEEESVSERIRRKSYFARFHDNRSRKHQNHHRKSLDVSRNHHMARLDDYALVPTDSIGRSFHSHENSHLSGRRNSISHDILDANDDDGNYPTLTRKSARHKHSSLPRNTAINSDDKYECDHSLPSTSGSQPLNDITSEEGDQQINYSNPVQKMEPPTLLSNGFCDTTSRALSPSTKMFSCPVSPKLTRHLSLIDDNVDGSSISRPITSSYNFDRRKTLSPLDACSQSRAKIRSRHDYIINRALSSIDEGMGITRPYSPTSRLSLIDNQLSDLRRFSAVLDNSSPRDVIRKALDVCNSLQY